MPRRARRHRFHVLLSMVAIGLTTGLATAVFSAQSFRARVDVVQVTVTVVDGNGRFVSGLDKAAFALWENGVEQEITEFTARRVPVSVGILLDASDSMRGQAMADAREAVDQFVGERLDAEDEAFIATFNHLPRLASLWKRPPSALRHALDGVQPSGGTAIWDALAESARLFERRVHTRAAFVVVSDGGDTASERSVLQALDAVRASDALVYAVAIDAPDARPSTRVNPDGLREMSGLTGGYTEVVRSTAELGPATTRIADELNSQYSVGYVSTQPPDGSWRSIRVRAGEHRTRHRRGYFAVPPKSTRP